MASLDTYLQQRQQALQGIKEELANSQNRMKQLADKRRSEREFQVGDIVYLKLKPRHLRTLLPHPSSKLHPRFYRPFPVIVKVGTVAYRLQLLEGSNIHSVFHISLLKKAVGAQPASSILPTLPQADAPTRELVAILDKAPQSPRFLIKWSDLHLTNNTWEYLPDILN